VARATFKGISVKVLNIVEKLAHFGFVVSLYEEAAMAGSRGCTSWNLRMAGGQMFHGAWRLQAEYLMGLATAKR
jgi:hypothetical protein